MEYVDTDPKEKVTSDIVKSPPIYIDDQIIDPLIELLKNTVGNENFNIKQLKLKQVKVQTKTPEIFITENNKIWKMVIRGLTPRTNTK